MLTVTVKKDEYVKIGEDIFIKFYTNPYSGQVKLGIEAPKDLNISRGAVFEKDMMKKVEAKEMARDDAVRDINAVRQKVKNVAY